MGHGGALVEAITLNRRVVGSTPALAIKMLQGTMLLLTDHTKEEINEGTQIFNSVSKLIALYS